MKEHETIVDKVLCFLCMGEKLILEMSLTFDTHVGDEYYILFAQSQDKKIDPNFSLGHEEGKRPTSLVR